MESNFNSTPFETRNLFPRSRQDPSLGQQESFAGGCLRALEPCGRRVCLRVTWALDWWADA